MVSSLASDSASTVCETEVDCRLPTEEDSWDPSIVLHYTYLALESKLQEKFVVDALKKAIVVTWKSHKTFQMKAMPPFGYRLSTRKSLIKLGLDREHADT